MANFPRSFVRRVVASFLAVVLIQTVPGLSVDQAVAQMRTTAAATGGNLNGASVRVDISLSAAHAVLTPGSPWSIDPSLSIANIVPTPEAASIGVNAVGSGTPAANREASDALVKTGVALAKVPAADTPASEPSTLRPLFDGSRASGDGGFPAQPVSVQTLEAARRKLYGLAGGSLESANARLSRTTTPERTAFFQSREFRDWVVAERAGGRRVFWLKDLDKTQAAGDIFTFFFRWRAENGKITSAQNELMKSFLKNVKINDRGLQAELADVDQNNAAANARLVIKLWRSKEQGGEGISLLEFWQGVYWPTQKGLTKKEKREQVALFAPHYAAKIYAGVREENLALKKAGVDVVIVSNGDQELAGAVASLLGIKRRNVVGSTLIYEKGFATGVNHSYEIFDKEWTSKPQPGKSLSFHYWVNANKWRWKWKDLDLGKIVVAGADGDSASSDGGMMTLLPPGSALGNFMIDTPREPGRIKKFHALAEKYGWTRGQFFTLVQDPAGPGDWDDSAAP